MGSDQGGVMADVLSKGRDNCYKVTTHLSLDLFLSRFDLFLFLFSLKARDAFYSCVEKEADKQPTEIATAGLLFPSQCKESRALYVSSCRASWVSHLLILLIPFNRVVLASCSTRTIRSVVLIL